MAQIETDCKNSKGIVAEIREAEENCKYLNRIVAKKRDEIRNCKNSKGIVAEIQEKETDCKYLDRILAKIRGKREKLQESRHIINRYKK